MKKILYAILMSVFLVACSEDADFSVSPSLRLEFSCDTLMFDTLFTSVGSPTAVVKVYNRNSSSLRLSSVTTKSGGASGFRINVDGEYAGVVRDVEIRKNDSMYVFVEATLDRNSADVPLLVTDSLLFMLESGVEQHISMMAYGRDVEIMRGRMFEQDGRIAKGHYLVYDSLVVGSGATLTIDAGAVLYFHKDVELMVRGRLLAQGTCEQPVVMRGDRTDNMFDYLPYDRIPGQWGGVLIDSASNGNAFVHCDIHSAKYGVKVVAGDTTLQRLAIESSRLENFDGNALETTMSHIDVKNSLIANARGNCVKVVGGNVRFVHCTIANFYVWKQRDVALALHNSIDGAPAPLRGALFANCIVEGSRNDEIMGYLSAFGDTVPDAVNYRFVSSLINTIEEEDDGFVNVVYDKKDVAPFAKEHFRLIDNSIFKYDFHLSDSTAARGIAAGAYSSQLKYDLDGVLRPDSLADAGCFQYVPLPGEE
ncbi:MAG: hypothetical protein IKV23_06505 [Bacteroidaceae bacterium]|nr:hypothetical protein [Bacteroidaceae bacterium]